MAETPYIFNIQKFSTHDGDGVRTTIFFKGCPLRCMWCHNPESQHYYKELIFHQHKCTTCGRCVAKCKQGANSIVDGVIPDSCLKRATSSASVGNSSRPN